MQLTQAKTIGAYMLAALMLVASFARPVQAGIIETPTALAAEGRAANLSRVQRVLNQAEVRDRLLAMGVDSEAVEARIASLSDAELASFADRLENAPAGAGLLEVLGILFVVLLVLEIVGVTDIFKSVGPATR